MGVGIWWILKYGWGGRGRERDLGGDVVGKVIGEEQMGGGGWEGVGVGGGKERNKVFTTGACKNP